MTMTSERRLFLQAWSLSAVFHGLVVVGALSFMAQMKPPVKDVFQWEVALVQPIPEETQHEMEPAHPASAAAPVSRAVEPVSDPTPHMATRETRTIERPSVVRRETPQIMEQTRPTEEPSPVPQREQTVRGPAPVTRTEPAETAPAAEHAPAISSDSTAAPAEAPSAVQNVRNEQGVRPEAASDPPREMVADSPRPTAVEVPKPSEQAAPAAVAPSSPAIMESPSPVAKADTPSSGAKADHRWLAESLWRRVAELKRYPSAARLNGLEGKVVLKAIIRSDGHLAEVSVQKSSGHSVLDEAAMEAVKQACPLHMKHELGTPHIVVSLPIVYSLAN
jgi:protein TonB